MTKDDIKRRISVFILGLGLSGFGVAMTTQAGLGTTPISSLPYVLTFLMPLSLGMLTLLLNVFLVFGQVLLLGRDFRKIQYLQIAATGVFGFFIDLGLFVLEPFRTGNYLLQLIMLFCGCAILGLGISCQLTADVMFIPGEGFVKALSARLKKEFGLIKISFDFSLVACAALASWVFISHLTGIREGTAIAAFAVGLFVKFFLPRLRFIRMWFYVRN